MESIGILPTRCNLILDRLFSLCVPTRALVIPGILVLYRDSKIDPVQIPLPLAAYVRVCVFGTLIFGM